MSLNAFVTLVTTDSYVTGAIVAIQSVLEAEGTSPANPFETVCLVTPATVSVQSIKSLRRTFSLVVGVEEIRSGSNEELRLLGRQDLASTLTKLQLFRLIQFRKVIFLDADILCLQPLSHLFSTDAPFSAAPDSGWPDCFNSGMFVATPSAETFDKLIQMSSERGSWDGGDQGLLNDFFPDWNRLSFTYNVTPSAYYTYAPAYRRHGAGIKLVHFIGSRKPWHEQGPSRQVPSTSESNGASDYANLLNRWFAVYQRHYATGKVGQQTTFVFPKLQATWDAPGGPTPYTPPSLEDLKRTFQGVFAGQGRSQQSDSFLISGSEIEGHYVSMPLKPGRPDLMGNLVFVPPAEAATTKVEERVAARPPSPVTSASPPPSLSQSVPAPPTLSFQASSPQPGSPGHWSPPKVSWDPAVSEPPKNDKPQMAAGFHQQFDNVWDGPRSAAQRSFFKAPTTYGGIPRVTHQDYGNSTRSHSPDLSKVKAVFPWESKPGNTARVFPDADRAKQNRPQSVLSMGGNASSSSSGSGQRMSQSAPAAPLPVSLATLSTHYTNAWDDVPAIRKYAESRQKPSASSTTQMKQPPSHAAVLGHQRSSSSSSSRGRLQRNGSYTASGLGPNSPRKPSEGYETGGEASSRDGDDEDEDEEDDSGDDRASKPSSRSASQSSSRSGGSKQNQQTRSPPQSGRATVSSNRNVPPPTYGGPSASASTASRLVSARSNSYNNGTSLTPNAAAAANHRNSRLSSASRTSSSETVTARNTSTSPSYHTAGLPDLSNGNYRPQLASRVFDAKTDTEHIKKEGLEALHRFVRNMEAKGAEVSGNGSAHANGNSNGNGNGSAPARQASFNQS